MSAASALWLKAAEASGLAPTARHAAAHGESVTVALARHLVPGVSWVTFLGAAVVLEALAACAKPPGAG